MIGGGDDLATVVRVLMVDDQAPFLRYVTKSAFGPDRLEDVWLTAVR